jgi:cell division protein FtsA
VKGGVVLTGGGELMQGSLELAGAIFGLPVRLGTPYTVGGLVEEFRSPEWATGVGLVLLGAESLGVDSGKGVEPRRGGSRLENRQDRQGRPTFGRLISWLKDGFF